MLRSDTLPCREKSGLLWIFGLLATGCLLLLAGCLGHTKGSVVPGTRMGDAAGASVLEKAPAFKAYGNYYVERLPADGRGINRLIVESLRERGLKAATGERGSIPPGADVIVRYQDRWMWDTTMYMIRLNMQLLTTEGELLASGESYRTSLVRKPPEFMINEILNQIYEDSAPELVIITEEPEEKITRRKRHGTPNHNSDTYRF